MRIEEILKSKAFRSILEGAALLLTKNKKVVRLAFLALKKATELGGLKKLGTKTLTEFKQISNLIYYYAQGKYTRISKQSLVTIVAVLLYFIMPIDLIPDLLPGMGYLDDITLLSWLFSTLQDELVEFNVWHKKHKLSEPIEYIELE